MQNFLEKVLLLKAHIAYLKIKSKIYFWKHVYKKSINFINFLKINNINKHKIKFIWF